MVLIMIRKRNFILILCLSFLTFALNVESSNIDETELPDFEFENGSTSFEHSNSVGEKDQIVNFTDSMDTTGYIDSSDLVSTKELEIKRMLLRATINSAYRRKMLEVLPIIRVLSKKQRVALASIFTAQSSRNNDGELNFKQVDSMFGERKNLILPIILDIANLVKKASITNEGTYMEDFNQPHAEFLKISKPSSVDEILVDQVKPMLMEENSGPNLHIKDERLTVNIDDTSKLRPTNSIDDTSISPIENKSVGRSYHERKLNMTNFNRTRDQEAIASKIHNRLVMPDYHQEIWNLSLEEREKLALKDLNGTVPPLLSHNLESLPHPEMLLGGPYFNNRPYRKNPILNDALSCERFGNVCLKVTDYPMQQIMGSIRRHKHAMGALLAEYADKRGYSENDDYGEVNAAIRKNNRREDDEGQSLPGTMCPSIVRYARPQKARSAAGEWKYIVNTGQHTQTLRLEKCSNPQDSCTYLTDNFRSRCLQIFNYHRLLSWDSSRGLHVDIFKVPTCCSCHIDGYREKFPPILSYDGNTNHNDEKESDHHFSASTVHKQNTQYTTINEEDEDEEPDGSIAYQFSNGFKPLNNQIKYTDDSQTQYQTVHANGKNTQYNRSKYITNPVVEGPILDSYLTPPNSKDPTGLTTSFRRGPAVKRKRPNRTRDENNISDSGSLSSPLDTITERTAAQRRRTVVPKFATPATSVLGVSVNGSPYSSKLPSISTAPTSTVDLGKRVNYNYHPIIDFFEEPIHPKEQIDRVGITRNNNRNKWKPVAGL